VRLTSALVRSPLAVILLASVLLRVAGALLLGDEIKEVPGAQDQVSYDAFAKQLVAGRGFTTPTAWWPITGPGEPTAHWSYLYTLFLAAVYGVFGIHPLAARLIQAIVAGLLFPWLTWRIGRRLFGERAGFCAAALAAGYGYFVYYAGALMTETFYILAVLLVIDVATGMVGNPTLTQRRAEGLRGVLRLYRPWLILGLALGTAILLRQVLLLFVPLLFAWLLWAMRQRTPVVPVSHPDWRVAVTGLVVTTSVIGLMILPWTIRNYLAFDRLVLLNTNAGYAFFWANHPIHGDDFKPLLPGDTYQRLIPAALRHLDEAALDQALLSEGVRFVVADPGRYARLSVSRVRDYFQFWPAAESGWLSNVVRVLSFGLCFPLMLYGLYLSLAGRTRSGDDLAARPVVLCYLFILFYTFIHLASWALIRYRLPVDAVLLPFAGLALAELSQRIATVPYGFLRFRVLSHERNQTTA
jgi:4-amino-4-deoxy-L-arabinose transferase-like glycosyltransferase